MNHPYQQPSPTKLRDNINPDMEFFDEDRRFAFSWQDTRLATSTAAASAQTLRGAANQSFYAFTGDASILGNSAFDDFVAPWMGDSFLTPMPMLHQPDFLPPQYSYPMAGTGHAFQPIARATAAQMNVAAPPNQPSGARANARHRTAETRISCTVDGCTKTFRRPGDYRRHVRKHQDPILKCIVDDCDMKFYRLDKLRDHIRQGHKMVL
ncbi:hypothetical protein AA0119_g1738 [Alternaria tenuissima]|uniref:C2H2-type domain-containing protein n=2 Tax=Alternaria alternata complex TaxID=187734 RepID=A0A4Q4NJE0_ALTAL|nr:hypothetical protein B0T12DRAFT_397334 [Alternaria alternata]RYN31641.1 hypothetical protein AA0115_g4207 [Alternaria tenuissima]RYN55142.1 hypothetical protein AA0114_g3399 [Alternaria tenuissima]RYN78031.1 hypothetical protein AA0117_g4626 [Alternaria alternata]RYN96180.1 hypothetical protein AA0120_g3143 [Alternaria tenuissima]